MFYKGHAVLSFNYGIYWKKRPQRGHTKVEELLLIVLQTRRQHINQETYGIIITCL
jgi:hypothetical protein